MTITPIADPALRGRYRVENGRAATAPNEIAVSQAAFCRLGVPLGGMLDLAEIEGARARSRHRRPSGQPRQRHDLGATRNDARTVTDPAAPDRYLVGARPFTWSDVLALNRKGFAVTSRSVLLHPPSRSAVPYLPARGREGCAVQPRDSSPSWGSRSGSGWRCSRWCCSPARHLRSVPGGRSDGSDCSASPAGDPDIPGGWYSPAALVLGIVGARGRCRARARRSQVSLVVEIPKYTTTDFGHYDVRPLEIIGIALVGMLTGHRGRCIAGAFGRAARPSGRTERAAWSGSYPRKVPTDRGRPARRRRRHGGTR